MRRLAIVLITLVALVASAQDQHHPNMERGVKPEKLYNFSEIDTVNTFNGNLTLKIAVGPAITVNGALSSQLILAYNSHAWDFENSPCNSDDGQPCDDLESPTPAAGMNAGLGWSLMFGGQFFGTGPEAGTYKTADGGGHKLGWVPTPSLRTDFGYTSDSSRLRSSQISSSIIRIEQPDGVIHTFTNLLNFHYTGQTGTWSAASAGTTNSEWRLTAITDRFGNSLTVSYSTVSPYSEIWTISNGGSQTISAYFKPESDLGSSTWSNALIDHVSVSKFGGGLNTYNFSYTLGQLPPPAGSHAGSTAPSIYSVPLLTGITLPDGESYSGMSYDAATDTATSGVLQSLTLPTGGTITWTYTTAEEFDNFTWSDRPKNGSHPITTVVTSRNFGGGTWTYHRRTGGVGCYAPAPNGQCLPYAGKRQLTAWVIAPDNTATISYFSMFVKGTQQRIGSDVCTMTESWLTNEYGLPFSRSTGSAATTSSCGTPPVLDPSINGGSAALTSFTDIDRFLSTEIRSNFTEPADDQWNGLGRMPQSSGTATFGTPLRSTWVRYDLDAYAQTTIHGDTNARQSAALTIFEDDPGACSIGMTASSCKYSGANSYGFDTFGHYRQSSSLSNFGGAASYRTTFTNYPGTLPGTSHNNWILGTYSEQCTVDEDRASPRLAAVSSCNELPAANRITAQVQFDGATGVMTAKRVKATTLSSGTTSDTHDLLSIFVYNTGDHGLVSREKFYGGDHNPLTSSSGFDVSADPDYEIVHNYTFSGTGSLTNVQSRYDGLSFLTEDVDIDASTGLVTKTRDSAGLETTYDYTDSMNRFRVVRPPGAACTAYAYANRTSATSPVATSVTLYPFGTDVSNPPAASSDKKYYYDEWGRLQETKTQMPDGWSTTWQDIDALGRVSRLAVPVYRSTAAFETLSPLYYTSYAYDAFGRPLSTVQPDGKSLTAAYLGISRVDRTIHDIAMPAGASNTSATTTESLDSLGRVSSVVEPSGATSAASPAGANVTTSYTYDVANHLTGVNQNSGGQTRSFVYDGRGFLLNESHPELSGGSTAYSDYDARGHALKKVTGLETDGFSLTYLFDKAERLTNVKDNGGARLMQVFNFAEANDGTNYEKGRLDNAIRYNHLTGGVGDVTVTEKYSYGSDGKVATRETNVSRVTGPTNIQTFTQVFHYNTLGELSSIDYPTVSGYTVPSPISSIANAYTNGLLTSVSRTSVTYGTFTYHPTNMVNVVTHGSNGGVDVRDIYAADPNGMSRPASIEFTGWEDCPSVAITASNSCPGATGRTASISAVNGATNYTWTLSAGTITAGQGTPQITYNAPFLVGSLTISVTVQTEGCSRKGLTTVYVVDGPRATVSGDATVAPNTPAQIRADLTGSAPWSITWSDGVTQSNVQLSPALRSVSVDRRTVYTVTAVSDATNCAGSANGSATITISLAAPTQMTATTQSNTSSVRVQWQGVSGAGSYNIERGTTVNNFQPLTATSLTSYTDTISTSSTPVTYLYRVSSRDGGGNVASAPSALDYATVATTLFTNPLVAGTTVIRGADIVELRKAVDAVRMAAGIGANTSWSYSPPTGVVSRIDNIDLRTALDQAVTLLLGHNVSYSSTPVIHSTIRAVHYQEIREAVK